MFKSLKRALILAILFNLVFSFNVLATVNYITDVNLFDLYDGRAKLSWRTQEATQARVYWGEDPNNLSGYYSYQNFDYNHTINIYGLQKNLTYYFKIVVVNSYGGVTESFLQTFSTKNMVDTILPVFTEASVVQITNDAAALYWQTNEETKMEIFYGVRDYDLNKRIGDGNFKKQHEAFLYKLDVDQLYYIKIVAEDRGGNKQYKFLRFRTRGYVAKNEELKIENIQPTAFATALIQPTSVTLKWETNLVAKSKVHYGLESGRYDKHIEACQTRRCLEHQVTLNGLEPNTIYYYKIEAYDSLYNKRIETRELTFMTSVYSEPAPQVLGVQTASEYEDADNDKLSDAYEYRIGTNPFSWDSDGDGYDDGNEMRHGWDPNVPGSTLDTKLQASNYYMPKREYSYRVAQDRELRNYVNRRLGSVQVSAQNWRTLSDAYIYGGYPAEAIVQAIRFGGQTVHPTISWSQWRNSNQYQSYINK